MQAIYDEYYPYFAAHTKDAPHARDSKIYVPVDVRLIAQNLSVDGDIVFGRLYYHLEKKYGYATDDGKTIKFFWFREGKPMPDRHCVNFPLMSAILASLREDNRKFNVTQALAIAALVISIISLLVGLA